MYGLLVEISGETVSIFRQEGGTQVSASIPLREFLDKRSRHFKQAYTLYQKQKVESDRMLILALSWISCFGGDGEVAF